MKHNLETALMVLIFGGTLAFIQFYHVLKHDTYCKTEAEWSRIYQTDKE